MELKEFVKITLLNIKDGVESANKELDSSFFALESYKQGRKAVYISFDIGVTTTASVDADVKSGIKLYVAEIGSKVDAKTEQQQSNRVKFEIAVDETANPRKVNS